MAGNHAHVKERLGGIYTQDVTMRDHHFLADEPESYGSADLGATPYELLCAALGACTSITLRMYADRKKWAVTHIAVDVNHKKVTQTDGASKDVFTRSLTVEGDLDKAARNRMMEIANKCPVHKTLELTSVIETVLA